MEGNTGGCGLPQPEQRQSSAAARPTLGHGHDEESTRSNADTDD